MRKVDIRSKCRVNSNCEKDTFVGLRCSDGDISINFPIGYHISEDDNELRKDIMLLFTTLSANTKRKESDVLRQGNAFDEMEFPLQSYLYLIKDFFEKIGEEETKRYFETAYKFVCEYKDLGEKYILSAKVHMDEQTPHMHLVFLPVVHTKDKKGNEIDKLACSEFWKEKDSYRRLQDAFYEYVISKGFDLERGLPKEETKREHFSIEEYKKITNFEKTKEILDSFNLEMPKVPDIKDFKIIMINRDEKILNEIIKPKDELIKDLYDNNVVLYKELSKQRKVVEKAVEYQKERNSIMHDNTKLHEQVEEIKKEYENKTIDLEIKYEKKFKKFEDENYRLNRIIDKFQENIKKFIKWICYKFDMGAEDNLIRDFEKETKMYLDAEKQIKHESMDKEFEMEI